MTPSDTNLLIKRTELKVAAQWAAAQGNTLAHSRGFSFRRPPGLAPASPPRSAPARGSLVLGILLAVLGVGALAYANHQPVPPPPLAGPLIW